MEICLGNLRIFFICYCHKMQIEWSMSIIVCHITTIKILGTFSFAFAFVLMTFHSAAEWYIVFSLLQAIFRSNPACVCVSLSVGHSSACEVLVLWNKVAVKGLTVTYVHILCLIILLTCWARGFLFDQLIINPFDSHK